VQAELVIRLLRYCDLFDSWCLKLDACGRKAAYGDTSMRTRTFMLAAATVALLGAAASGQYGPMPGAAGPYPSVMAPTYMPDPGMGAGGGGMMGPQGAYAGPAFNPASYAGIGGPAPMGPGPMPASPSMTPMAPMSGPMGAMPGQMGAMPGPMGPGGADYSGGYGGGGDYGGYGDCGPQGWTHHYFAYGEFLYLRPGNAEVAYAVPVNAAAAGGGSVVQTGPVHVADPDYAPAFRVGFGGVISPRTSLAVSYTSFDHNTFDSVIAPGPAQTIHSLITSPNTLTGSGNGVAADAILQTEFKLVDVDVRSLLIYNPQWQVNYLIGARYGNLEQHLMSGIAGPAGFEQVLAESEFDGGGVRTGLEGLRFHPTSQFFWYGRGYASFLAGTFRARYEYDSPNNATPTITSLNVGRVVTMLDFETGLGWQNFTGNVRFSVGYMFSAWYNTVRLNDFISSVQTNSFAIPSSDLRGLVTFDGLQSRIEVLW
jgi:hypothetical protein